MCFFWGSGASGEEVCSKLTHLREPFFGHFLVSGQRPFGLIVNGYDAKTLRRLWLLWANTIPKVMKLVPESGPGPPFWVPTEGLDVFLGLFALMWPYSEPRGRFLEDAGVDFWSHLEPEIHESWCWFSRFLYERSLEGFWSSIGVVLGVLLVP